MENNLEERPWWSYLEEDLQELLKESLLLLSIFEVKGRQEFHDYAFVVFPAAKAYEGFLKKLFLDLGLISENEYYGKRFRIGKALNPHLERPLRQKEGIYDKLVAFCRGPELANKLWDTWKMSRNLVFHWFPNERNAIDKREAGERIAMILNAIDMAFEECKIEKSHA